MVSCGKAKADEVLKAREAAGGLPPTGLTNESSVFQLLLAYTEYLDQEDASAGAKLDDLNAAVKAANSGGGPRARLAALQSRALHFATQRKYPLASEDLVAALGALDEWERESGGALSGEAAVQAATLLRWCALFRHVRYDLAGALELYERAAGLAAGDPVGLTRVHVMRSGVLVDRGDIPGAEAAISAAGAAEVTGPALVDVLMHRSQLLLLKPDHDASEVDLRKCLALKPDHVVALLRLAMLLIQQAQTIAATGDSAAAMAKVEEAEEVVRKAKARRPRMSEVFQVQASVCEVKGDVAGALKANDKAIALDPLNSQAYMNKGMVLSQSGNPQSQEEVLSQLTEVIHMYEKAIEVDPLNSQAHKLYAEMRCRFAAQFTEMEDILAKLQGAIVQCRDPTELNELCSFSCIASAQLEAARDLGLSSFAEMAM